jgi:hypothetical protein
MVKFNSHFTLRHGESESECLNDEEAKRESDIALANKEGDARRRPSRRKSSFVGATRPPSLCGFFCVWSAAKSLLGALTEKQRLVRWLPFGPDCIALQQHS